MVSEKEFTKKELQEETTKMAYLFGLLHYHYARTLVKELGEKRGEDLIRKAIKAFAIDRGQSMKKKALALGLKPTMTNLKEVNDLPAYTFSREEKENTICPLADAWQEKGELGQALGLIYCNINDPWKNKSFDEKANLWRYIKNRNLGDSFCDAVNVEYLE